VCVCECVLCVSGRRDCLVDFTLCVLCVFVSVLCCIVCVVFVYVCVVLCVCLLGKPNY